MSIVHHDETHRMNISQIIITITFVIGWYSNFFTYDFITPSFQFFHGLYFAFVDSSVIQYMAQRTMILNEARAQGESTIDKVLDLLVKIISWLGGVVVILFTPTLQAYGQRLKTYLTKRTNGYTKRKK